jgi:hypothetical protein
LTCILLVSSLIDMIFISLFLWHWLSSSFCLSVVGDAVSLFAGANYSSVEPLVIHRVKKLALICIYAVHQKRWVQILKADIWNILLYLFLLITWFKNTFIRFKWNEYPLKFVMCAWLSFSRNIMNFINGR